MRWTKTLPILMLVGLMFTPPSGATHTETGTCTPGADQTAVGANTVYETFYVRVRDGPGKVVELWQETNGIPGLQYAAGMGCGHDADHLIVAQCISTICLTIGG